MSKSPNVELNSRAHSRPPVSLNTPCLTRHVAIFFPERMNDAGQRVVTFDRRTAQAEVKGYIRKLYSAAKGATYEKDADTILDEAFRQRRTAVVNLGMYLSLNARVKADLYSEHCTITIILDNHAREFTPTFCPELTEVISTLRSLISTSHPNLPEGSSPDDLVHSVIWRAFDQDFKANISGSINGTVFGDFRGFAVCASDDIDLSDNDSKRQLMTVSFRTIPAGINLSPNPKDLYKYVKANRTFFDSCLGLDEAGSLRTEVQPDVRWESNNIFCEMLDGGALYGSALGNPLIAASEINPIPIKYFIIYNGLSSYQLGRLIRRIHTLGELRLAALFDRDEILKLTNEIRVIGSDLSRLIDDATAFPEKNIDIQTLESIIHRYNELGSNCVGSLLYRVNRSSYYYDALESRLPDLRHRPIEGWQSYVGFVKRNFGQTYRAIASIGDRYKQIGIRIDRSLSLYHAQRQHLVGMASVYAAIAFGGVGLTFALTDKLNPSWGRSLIIAAVSVLAILALFFGWIKLRYVPKRVISSIRVRSREVTPRREAREDASESSGTAEDRRSPNG